MDAETLEVCLRAANEGRQVGGASSGITQRREAQTNALLQYIGGGDSRKKLCISAETKARLHNGTCRLHPRLSQSRSKKITLTRLWQLPGVPFPDPDLGFLGGLLSAGLCNAVTHGYFFSYH